MRAETESRCQSRAVVSYVGGGWTDRLVARYLGIDHASGAPRLMLELVPKRTRATATQTWPLEEFVSKRNGVDSVLLVRPPFRSEVLARVREIERGDLSVLLRAAGHDVTYPASAVFGPDGITLTLG